MDSAELSCVCRTYLFNLNLVSGKIIEFLQRIHPEMDVINDVYCWVVDKGETGWGVHRDRETMSFIGPEKIPQ